MPMSGSGRTRLLVLHSIAVLAATVVTSMAQPASPETGVRPSPRPAPVAAAPATPVPTPIPTPVPTPSRDAAETGLQEQILAALGGTNACVIVRDGDRLLAAHNAVQPVMPASTQKVLVAAAALHQLGAGHRFVTPVVSSAPPVAGIVDDLWLVGGGDPVLATADYAAFLASAPRWQAMPPTPLTAVADAVVAAGVREVRGRVLGDDTRHSPQRLLPTWKSSYVTDGNISPMSALTINSGWAPFFPRTPMADPTSAAAAELTRLLRERGVHVVHEPGPGVAPADAHRLGEVHSAPIVQILTGMLHSSDNVTAEMVTRELGFRRFGDGSTAAGTRAVVELLADLGADVSGVALSDGSGLDRNNRATCRVLADTLMLRPGGVDLSGHLALAGRSGTLWRRMAGLPWDGRLSAKTGWIAGVVGLTGRIDFGRPLRFALVQNGVPSLEAGRATEHRVLEVLAARSAA